MDKPYIYTSFHAPTREKIAAAFNTASKESGKYDRYPDWVSSLFADDRCYFSFHPNSGLAILVFDTEEDKLVYLLRHGE